MGPDGHRHGAVAGGSGRHGGRAVGALQPDRREPPDGDFRHACDLAGHGRVGGLPGAASRAGTSCERSVAGAPVARSASVVGAGAWCADGLRLRAALGVGRAVAADLLHAAGSCGAECGRAQPECGDAGAAGRGCHCGAGSVVGGAGGVLAFVLCGAGAGLVCAAAAGRGDGRRRCALRDPMVAAGPRGAMVGGTA